MNAQKTTARKLSRHTPEITERNCAPSIIKNPGLVARAQETYGYVADLAGIQAEIRERLLGPLPSEVLSETYTAPDLESLLALICEKLACLVGEARTILDRV